VEPVPIIGGTGSLGFGLALRWARAGVPVVIGSRAAERAEESAGKLRERVPDAQVEGLVNAEAARRGPIVFLTVPFRNQSENLTNLREVLEPGQILVDATVPLAAAVSGKATRLLGVPQGSAGQQAQEMAPEGVRVVSTLHTVSASNLNDLDVELDEDIPVAGRQASRGGADRPHPGAAAGERRPARERAADRGPHADAHRGELPLQDARRDQVHRAARRALVTVLAGGTGGAKLARGMLDAAGALTVVANTADDCEMYGVHVAPDPDLVTYWLADAIDERGYGIAGDTWEIMGALERVGWDTWFRLGDRDLAMCLVRTELLRAGERLTAAHAAVVRAMGVEALVLPMSDEPVRTFVRSGEDVRSFQEFMIVHRAEPPIDAVELRGIEAAEPTAEVLGAIESAEAIVIGPSNPVISIGPILGLPGVREALRQADAPVVAVSPFVGGAVVKGPTEPFMEHAGLPLGPAGVAAAYGDVIDGIVSDEPLDAAAVPVLVTDTLMHDAAARRRLATETLEFAAGLAPAGRREPPRAR
jgi:LPPG:FO 2-phospho-L-lactate transferase